MRRTSWRDDDDAGPPLDFRLVLPALSLWAGMLVGFWARSIAWAVISVCAAGAIVTLIAGLLRRRRSASCDTRIVRYAVVTALICGGAATFLANVTMSTAAADPLVRAGASQAWVVISMDITQDPATAPNRFARDDGEGRWRLTGNARHVGTQGFAESSDVHVTVFGQGDVWGSLTAGQRIVVRGTADVDHFRTVPSVVIRARGDPSVVAPAPLWDVIAAHVRSSLAQSAAAIGSDAGGLLRGLVVGDTGGIDEKLSADTKTTGLTHLVAVSGTHMAIVSAMVLLLLRRTGPRISAIGVSMALVTMVILVGPGPSVLRSVLMGLIGVLGVLTGRERNALSALAAAVFGLLLVDPSLAVSIGFTLSVQATAALIVVAPVWIRALTRRGMPRGWAEFVVLPVAAHLATLPVIAAISGRISLVAIPANMAVAPVVAPAMLLGLGCAIVSPWWAAGGRFLAHADSPMLGWVTGTAHHLATWPSATVPWPASGAGIVVLAILVVAGGLALRHRFVRALVLATLVGGGAVLLPAHTVQMGWPADDWVITACDVGQGDAMVLSTDIPGDVVVVDTGPDPDLIDTCLASLGVTTIALLVITHLHSDHVGGLAGAIRGRRVDAIGIGPDRSSAAAWRAVQEAAAARGAPVTQLAPGMRWDRGGLSLDILGPSTTYHGTDSDPNNDSVVMMASHRGVRMLMTGDIERPAQQSLLDSGVDLQADILKQPHHGSSKLLPSFVAAVRPTVAVIGVGRNNDYGHPADRALAIDRAAGVISVLRTDRAGDAEVLIADGSLATVARGVNEMAR